MVNPFLLMASFSCFNVALLPGFSFTTANPFSRFTCTESTPETAFRDTLTAWAHTSQSIPKILMSMDLISADADATSIKSAEIRGSIFLIRFS
jgi:hypothetical protein